MSWLCASYAFLTILVSKITQSDCLLFKDCMCKTMLCLYHSIHVEADVVLWLKLQNSFCSKSLASDSERFFFLG